MKSIRHIVCPPRVTPLGGLEYLEHVLLVATPLDDSVAAPWTIAAGVWANL